LLYTAGWTMLELLSPWFPTFPKDTGCFASTSLVMDLARIFHQVSIIMDSWMPWIRCPGLRNIRYSPPFPGHAYHFLENLQYVQRVARHQGWNSFGLLGHSMGAGIASLYAATFPEQIKALIMLDLIKPVSRRVDELLDRTRQAVESRLELETKMASRPEKVYPTHEEALARLLESSTFMHGKDNVTEESAAIMLQRGAKQVEGGWQYTRDRRLQVTSLYGLPPEFLLEFCRNIRCPHLLVKADSQKWDTEELNRAAVEAYCTNPLYEYRAVPGPHHVHLNNPEIVAAPILTFLERHNNLEGPPT